MTYWLFETITLMTDIFTCIYFPPIVKFLINLFPLHFSVSTFLWSPRGMTIRLLQWYSSNIAYGFRYNTVYHYAMSNRAYINAVGHTWGFELTAAIFRLSITRNFDSVISSHDRTFKGYVNYAKHVRMSLFLTCLPSSESSPSLHLSSFSASPSCPLIMTSSPSLSSSKLSPL